MHKTTTIYNILVVIMLAMLPMTGSAQSNSTDINKPTRSRVDKNKQKQSKEEKKDNKKDDKKDNSKDNKKTEPAKPKQEVKQETKPVVKTEPAKPKVEETKTEPAKTEPVKTESEKPKPEPNPAETRHYDGIDVSKHQETIDWEAIKKNPNIQYVYIKATEGCTHTDHRYEENIRNARKHGVKVGSYHYLTNRSSAVAQFENFRMTVRKDEQDLIPFIDVEECSKWTSQQLRDSLKVFADLYEDHFGVKPIIYTSENFFNKHLGRAFADYPLFIAKYSKNQPSTNGIKWIMWQFSDRGRIKGIKGNVDLSCFNKGCTINDLLYKPGKAKPRGGNVNSSVDRKDKPSQVNMGTEQKPKEKPAPSKREQQEAKKKAEKEAKAKERSKKLQEEEAKKKAEEEKKAKQKAQERAKQEAAQKAKQDAEAQKAKQQQAKKQAAQKAKQQKAQRQAAQKQQQASTTDIKTNKSPKLTQSQRNDSIRTARQQGHKINKSSADND